VVAVDAAPLVAGEALAAMGVAPLAEALVAALVEALVDAAAVVGAAALLVLVALSFGELLPPQAAKSAAAAAPAPVDAISRNTCRRLNDRVNLDDLPSP